jgi:hypothetical protein
VGACWQRAWRRISESCLPLERFTVFIASALTLVAGFCHSRFLHYLCLSVAAVLFLIIVADMARSLLDDDLNKPAQYASVQGPPKRIAVNAAQVLFTALLALIYASMIFAGLHTLFLSSAFMFLVMTSGVLAFSTLAAWRNVRLWYREGADYEQALKEEAGRPRRLHIPPRD